MSITREGIKCISLNEFLEIEMNFCFVCGKKEYAQIYIQNHLYRICKECLKTNNKGVRTFLRYLQKGKAPIEAIHLTEVYLKRKPTKG